ncbi:MAG TPA: nucleotidyltransferase substrate binding protein, partial [Ignavibacteriales bacterium]|nr:nucleotidyltransferase substrate binding protein [Ignavibacteriales bacterium]
DSIKEAFNLGIIQNGNIWLEALQARNLTSHVYDEEISEKVFIEIKSKYILIFSELFNKFTKIKND